MMGNKIVQFGFRRVSPASMNWVPVLDCRMIRNPFVKGMTHQALIDRVRANKFFPALVETGRQLLEEHDVLYVGCEFGRHRSGAVAEEIARITGATIEKV